jgi:hypothetical protein
MSASVFTPVLQQFMAQFMKRLRAEALATQIVDRSFDPAPAERGDTINITLPTVYTPTVITPGAAPVEGTGAAPVKVPLVLDQWYDNAMNVNDKQLGEIQKGILDTEIDSLVVGLVEEVNASVYRKVKRFYNVAGGAGTNPFATNEDPLLAAIQLLDESKAPQSDRVGILTPAAKNKALKIDAMTRYDARGDGKAKITGVLGNAYGVDIMMDQLVQTHTSTPLTAGNATANGAQAVGVGSTDGGRTGTLSIAKASNAAPLVAGDVLTIAGDPQTYVVLTGVTLAVGNTSVAIAPALTKATAGGEVITLTATHKMMPVMHKKAISFASRPVASLQGIGNIFTMVDKQTGLAITVELTRQHYQNKLAVSCLWGVESFRPEFGTRLLG